MDSEFINLTPENLSTEHLCCIIRSKKPHPGVEAKRRWLEERLREGHVFRKLNSKGCAMMEYAPLETAWVPIMGENYLYIYCLWVQGELKGHGYGQQLMDYCLEDAKAQGKSGVCMLGAQKQKAWLSDQGFAKRAGFQTVDVTADGYELLALSFDGSLPSFTPRARQQTLESRELTIFYDDQCPFIPQRVEKLRAYCEEHAIPAAFIHVETLEQAKALPCVFNNWAVCWDGKLVTVNQLDAAAIEKLVRR